VAGAADSSAAWAGMLALREGVNAALAKASTEEKLFNSRLEAAVTLHVGAPAAEGEGAMDLGAWLEQMQVGGGSEGCRTQRRRRGRGM